eukprot:1932469-Prymnesium_polylepis.2
MVGQIVAVDRAPDAVRLRRGAPSRGPLGCGQARTLHEVGRRVEPHIAIEQTVVGLPRPPRRLP